MSSLEESRKTHCCWMLPKRKELRSLVPDWKRVSAPMRSGWMESVFGGGYRRLLRFRLRLLHRNAGDEIPPEPDWRFPTVM